MKITQSTGKIKSLATKAAKQATRLSRALWRVLSFSLSDRRIAAGQCLSIELSTEGVFVVYASRFLSRLKIKGTRRYLFEAGKLPTPQNVAQAAVLAVSDLNAGKARIILVIPKAWVVIKSAEFPLTVKDNLSTVVSYELDRLTPLKADSAFYDFRSIGENENRLNILLAAMNIDILQPYLESLQEKGIHVSQVTTSTSAMGTLTSYIRHNGNTIFILIHTGGYEGGLVCDGQWQRPLAGTYLSGDDQAKALMIAEQINPLVDIIKKEGKKSEIIISHSPSEQWCLGLPERLQAPVRFIRETDLKIPLRKEVDPKGVSPQALGGALENLWPAAAVMNLLTRGIHPSLRTPVLPSAILLLIIAILGLYWILSPLQIEERKLAALDREIVLCREDVKKVEALKKEVENAQKEILAISDFKTSRPMALVLLKEMTRILPKKAWLSRMRIANTVVEIEGYAASATELLPKLEASPYFQKVDFASSTFRDARMNADRFAIKMEIEGLPEERAGHEKKK